MGRTDDPPSVSREPDGRAETVDREEGEGELASRSHIARRLHRIALVGFPLITWFAFRAGLRFDRPTAVTSCLLWLPVFAWGACTRTRRVKLHALLVIVPVYAIALASLIDIGGMPGATSALLLPIVLVGLFFGRRAAYATTVLIVLTVTAVGAAFGAGWLEAPDPGLSDVTLPAVWIRMAVSQATIGLVLVSAVTTLLTRYERSLQQTRGALRALHAEQERRERDAREAVATRDEFLVIASHELRTPLTPLLLEVQGLERRARNGASPQGAELSGQLERTVDHVKRLARLVEDLVDVSNILAGKLTVLREPVDLAAVVRGVAQRLEAPRARSGSTLALDVPSGCVGAWDHARLDQVITNLLGNAIKYGAGKPIEISLEVTAERVTLVVRDHGIGIDDGARARLFGRFQRAVPSKHYGGFGVGLWTVKQIVNALDGEVRLDSAPDAGTSIVVVLPRGAHVPAETELRPRERGRPRETGPSAASGMH